MPIGPFIRSGLSKAVEELPEQTMKAEAVPNVLAKRGVKPEEIKFSGVDLPTVDRDWETLLLLKIIQI